MKRLIILPLTVLLYILFSLTAVEATAQEITVGFFDFKPISYLDENKQPAGIYIDILNHIAQQENWDIHYTYGTWNEGLSRVKKGDIDLMICLARTSEREKKIEFSKEGVVTLWGEIYTIAGNKVESILDLKGKKIAIMQGDINGLNFQTIANEFHLDCKFVLLPSLHEVSNAIEFNEVYAGVLPSLFGIVHHDEHRLIKTPIIFNAFSVYFGAPKGTNKAILATLDSYLREWKTDPNSYYNQRLDFWLGSEQYDQKIIPKWLLFSISVLLMVAVLFGIWVKFLRKQITNKTRALKKSTERYQIIFNTLSDAIVIHAADDGKILDINETMLAMVGCTREEALHSIDILTRGEPPYSAAEAGIYLQRAAQGEDQLFEWKIKRNDGSYFWCEVALKANVVDDQKIIIAVARDIEERKRHEDQLLHSHRMEAIGSLAGGIAHDFNNILTGIFGYTELAQFSKDKPEKLDEYLGEIQTSAQRAQKLITQIQTFSKKHKSQRQPLELAIVTKEVLKLLGSSLPSTITVIEELRSNSFIHADPTQLHQVILNLCTNSAHAMEKTPGSLTVQLTDTILNTARIVGKHLLKSGDYVMLTIADTGHGIDRQIIKHIFDPYFTTKEQGKGTGLGLATVQGIIDSHGGGIEVQSIVGHGTIFRIYLPILKQEDKAYAQDTPQPQETLKGGDETILMVDDEQPIIKALSTILRNFGYTVHTYTDPVEALMAFSKNPAGYDLLLTDMTMPKLTGADLAEQVLDKRPDLPIIIATGNTELINQENAAKLGIKTYCAKPIALPTLLTAVRQALDS